VGSIEESWALAGAVVGQEIVCQLCGVLAHGTGILGAVERSCCGSVSNCAQKKLSLRQGTYSDGPGPNHV
jgi:hypothetical protein